MEKYREEPPHVIHNMEKLRRDISRRGFTWIRSRDYYAMYLVVDMNSKPYETLAKNALAKAPEFQGHFNNLRDISNQKELNNLFFDPDANNSTHVTFLFSEPVWLLGDKGAAPVIPKPIVDSVHLTVAARHQSIDGNQGLWYYHSRAPQKIWFRDDINWANLEAGVDSALGVLRQGDNKVRNFANMVRPQSENVDAVGDPYHGYAPAKAYFKAMVEALLQESKTILAEISPATPAVPGPVYYWRAKVKGKGK